MEPSPIAACTLDPVLSLNDFTFCALRQSRQASSYDIPVIWVYEVAKTLHLSNLIRGVAKYVRNLVPTGTLVLAPFTRLELVKAGKPCPTSARCVIQRPAEYALIK